MAAVNKQRSRRQPFHPLRSGISSRQTLPPAITPLLSAAEQHDWVGLVEAYHILSQSNKPSYGFSNCDGEMIVARSLSAWSSNLHMFLLCAGLGWRSRAGAAPLVLTRPGALPPHVGVTRRPASNGKVRVLGGMIIPPAGHSQALNYMIRETAHGPRPAAALPARLSYCDVLPNGKGWPQQEETS